MTLRSRQRREAGGRTESLEFGPNLPCFRMFQNVASGQSLTNNTEAAIQFDCWENGNDNVFQEGTVTAGKITQVSALIEGVYALSFVIELPDIHLVATAKVGICFEEGAMDFESPGQTYPVVPVAGDNGQTAYAMTHIRGYPPVWLRCNTGGTTTCSSAPCLPRWQFNVIQDSGIAQDVGWAMAEIYLIGGLSVDTSELGP